MRRAMVAAVAGTVALILPLPALAECVPIPPRTWAETIQFANHVSVTKGDFETNRCAFTDGRLNGFDAVVFDVASHAGLDAAVTWDSSNVTKPEGLTGFLLTAECRAVPFAGFQGVWDDGSGGETIAFSIPSDGQWLLVYPYTKVPGKDISVTVSSAGRACPEPEEEVTEEEPSP